MLIANNTNAQLTATISELNQTIKELKERIGTNSKNSSKPPSSDLYNKPSPKSLRKKSGKARGGQKGHKGTTLAAVENPDTVVRHLSSSCADCPHRKKCEQNACVVEKRQVIDAEFKINVTEHRRLKVSKCPVHHCTIIGSFPDGISAPVKYGNNLQGFIVALNTIGTISLQRTQDIVSGMFHIPLSVSTISSMVNRCAQKAFPAIQIIREKLRKTYVTFHDETGIRMDGKKYWVHSTCTGKYINLSANRKRGADGIADNGILPKEDGIAVHDCWKPYWTLCPNLTHAVCNAHILRELTWGEDHYPMLTWAPAFKTLLLAMKKAKEKDVSKEKSTLSGYLYRKFNKEYDRIIGLGYEETPIPQANPSKKKGKVKRGKVLSLIDRLKEYKASVCLFIRDFRVPFICGNTDAIFQVH